MKRVLTIALLFAFAALTLCACGEDEGYPSPTKSFFVNDFADVITDDDELYIRTKAEALNNATTAQVVTVTVESLGGEEPADYAVGLGREWGVGAEEADNGIVILLSEGDREIYIAVGYGLEGALPDSKTGRIIDRYGMDFFKNDNFSEGLKAVADAVINEVYIEYGQTPEEGYVSIDQISETSDLTQSGASVVVSWIIMLVIVFLVLRIFGRRGRFFWFGGPGSFGGFSGGSSFGGGGFSGGGGSFGGGGAGRGF